jgi:flagellar hook-length control protein FliK
LPLPEAKAASVTQASASAPPAAPPPNASPAKSDADAPTDHGKAAPAQPAVGHAAPSQDVAAPAPARLAPADRDRQPAGDAPKTGPDTTTQPLNVIQTAAPSSNAATVAAAKPTDAATQSPIAVAVPIEGVAVAIASKAADGKKSFDIRLDPPDLGRIHVHLDVDSSGQITSHVIADRSDTLDLLRRDSSGLERAFQDAGLKTSSNGLQFSLRDQSQGQTGQQQQPMPSSHLIVADEPTIDTPAPVYRLLTGARGGLDIRV